MNIVHGVCVGDWQKFEQNVVPTLAGPVIELGGQTSIARAYNTILEAFEVLPDILVLQHDDLEITDPDWVAKLEAVFAEDNVGIVGVAGGKGVRDLAWWNADAIGHQQTDGLGMLEFGDRRSGDVVALEGSFLAVGPWFIQNIRFDEQYPGFHGYDSIVMDVVTQGKRAIVADIDTHHHTRGGFSSPESEAQWHECNRRYVERWDLIG